MKKILATLAAFAIGFAVAHYSGALTKLALFEGQRALYTKEKLTADLEDSMPLTLGVLRKHFPADYEVMITGALNAIKESKDAEAVRLQVSEVVASTRRKYAAHIAKAGDEQLINLVALTWRLLENVEAGEGPAVCGAVAINGANAIPIAAASKYFSSLDETGSATFLTIHSGMTAPIDHGQVTNDDWAAIITILRAGGMTEEELAVVSSAASEDSRYCGLIIRFLTAVENYQGAAGARVRAAFAAEVGAA